ncbi:MULTISPECIES: peptidoglycan D,D-transpeptidase FtsI family protein [unclassified Pseudomonas]|uniref:peptidoglycan D,D-transpeptidase FtsI family protein n=1 Tax=unclassified Pseudomonas TaxID=196821 RepID=UPI001462B4DC|nr:MULTISPECIES: penicillin-binding protein 2 [unclassified Pseudomonas]QJI21465.1 penicillin-binding protein 2 [Pseudomonas sp. ADAK21]QJI23383.1 penicillin-binding protein 2 [Pseudomonas sp. ADAK20]
MKRPATNPRFTIVLAVFYTLSMVLAVKITYLMIFSHEFLSGEGRKRSTRVTETVPVRGTIFDRFNQPLAVSTPVSTLWVNPKQFAPTNQQQAILKKHLDVDESLARSLMLNTQDKSFAYLARKIDPELANKVIKLSIPGVYERQEYKRYYPQSSMLAQSIGFTNIDQKGIEGIELMYNHKLSGKPGVEERTLNLHRRVTREVLVHKPITPGDNLYLTIDSTLQHYVEKALRKALINNAAKSASAILIHAKTGEILALSTMPSFNPNARKSFNADLIRNRVFTDVYEPGSVIKPFSMAAVLTAKIIDKNAIIQIAPGFVKINGYTIRDVGRDNQLDLAGIIRRSSNVGMSKVAIPTGGEVISQLLTELGFGINTSIHFPGESVGTVPVNRVWSDIATASLSYGYSLSVNLAQLVQAYTVFANEGDLVPLSIIKGEPNLPRNVISPEVANSVLDMMVQAVDGPGAGGKRAAIDGYVIAGKSGTSRKASSGGYESNKYRAMFVGIAPANAPEFIMAVIVDEPTAGGYFGGAIAAPIFKEVLEDVLRIRNIPSDESQFSPTATIN